MDKTPNSKRDNQKFGQTFSRLKTKLSSIIQDAVQKVNSEEKNNVETWDDEHIPEPNLEKIYQHAIKAQDIPKRSKALAEDNSLEEFQSETDMKKFKTNKPQKEFHSPRKRPEESSDNDDIRDDEKYKKTNIRGIIFFILGLIILALLTVLWFKNSSSKRLSLAPVGNEFELEPGDKKLDSPIFGQKNPNDKMQASGKLQNIDFDFSPIISHEISRTPILPNKIKEKVIQQSNATDDFEDIWNGTESRANKTVAQTALDKEMVKNPKRFLPPWRRFSSEYLPTENQPTYSVILRYNPNHVSVSDLPDGTGYNVVVPGFVKYSEPVVKELRTKNYEVLLYLPMDNDGGKLNVKPIKFGSAFDVIRQSVAFHTSQLGGDGFVGFMNYGGKQVRKSLPEMNFLMSLLSKTGYLYVDFIHRGQKSLAFASAEGQKVPTVKVSNHIQSVQTEFPKFINHVKKDGSGIVIIDATPENIVALKQYEHALKSEPVKRIPISAILKHKMIDGDSYE